MQTTKGELNFLSQRTESSLFRNSKVLIRRLSTGDDEPSQGIDPEQKLVAVIDARTVKAAPTLEENGFELLSDQPPSKAHDFLDSAQVIRDYYPDCEELLAAHTGGQVFAFDHNIRSAGGQSDKIQLKQGQNVQGPAHMVHGDYTLRSAPERLLQLTKAPAGNDTLKGVIDEPLISEDLANQAIESGRFAIINVWRNIDSNPVATHPLALCDGQSVRPEDLVVFEIHYDNRIGENYFSKVSEAHRFYYYPHMTHEEALLIKQWDSAGQLAQSHGKDGDRLGEPCTFSFHTAFKPADEAPDAADRWSIEVRCIVIYV